MFEAVRNFHANEVGGERDNLNTLLILALIVIPLVLVIVGFGDKVKQMATDAWSTLTGVN